MKVLQPGFNINWIEFDYIEGSMGLNSSEEYYFDIYPNPTSDYLNISNIHTDFKVQIYSILGSKLLDYSNARRINVESLNNGVYLIKIINQNRTYSKVFVKK